MASLIDPSSLIERLISWRDAIRWLFAIAGDSRHSSTAGILEGARNTNIHNSTFILNQYGRVVPDHANTAGAAEERQNSGHGPNASSGDQEYDRLPSLRRESPDIYVDRLLTKSRGYPLWIPSPSTSLPVLNRRLGVSPGDVGIFTPEGGFDYLFNILHESTHLINAVQWGVPDGFIPFEAAVGPEFVEWNAGSYLADSTIIRVDDGGDPFKIILEATGPEGAVLMIPKEIRTTSLRTTLLLYEYIEKNIASWYKFARHVLGPGLKNGDLQVVYGCRKSSGYGIATAFNTPGQRANTRLTFSVNNDWVDIVGCPYRWTHTGSAEFKAGPSHEENSEILLTEPARNQCLFANAVSPKVSPAIWEQICDPGVVTTMDEILDDPSVAKQSGSGSTQRSTDKSNTQMSANPSSRQYNEAALHPSAILLDALQTILPGLAVYMTCDDDWADFITNKDMDVHQFMTQVLEKRIIIEHQGMAYFSGEDVQNLQNLSLDNEPVFEIRFIRTKIDDLNDTESYYWQATRTRLSLESLNTESTAASPSGTYSTLSVETGSLYDSEWSSVMDHSSSYSVTTAPSSPGSFISSSLVSDLPYENKSLDVIEAGVNSSLLLTNASGSNFRRINAQNSISHFPSASRIVISSGSFVQNKGATKGLKPFYDMVAPHAILNSGRRADPVRCYPGTREEVIARMEKRITNAHTGDRGVFWLTGPAGAGKSAIMQSVAERCIERQVPMANFFFLRADSTRNHSRPVVATLLYQLFDLFPALRTHVTAIASKDPLIFRRSIQTQFSALIDTPLRAIEPSSGNAQLVILIDGLDECSSGNGQDDQVFLLNILHDIATRPISPASPAYIVIVASRTEAHLKVAFNRIGCHPDSVYLDESYRPSDDIRLFLTHKFKEIQRTHSLRDSLPDDWPLPSDIDALIERSSGQFVYPATVARFISDSAASPRRTLEIVLGFRPPMKTSPFATLDSLYTFVLSQAEDWISVRDILAVQSIISSPSWREMDWPLPAIIEPLGYTKDDIVSSLSDLTALMNFRAGDKHLTIYHNPLYDFLLNQRRAGDFYVDINAVACRLAPLHFRQSATTLNLHCSVLVLEAVTEPDEQLTHFLKMFLPDPNQFRQLDMNPQWQDKWVSVLAGLYQSRDPELYKDIKQRWEEWFSVVIRSRGSVL